MEAEAHPARWKTLLAFGIIYFVWGSTFLAIRIGVHEVPPLMLASLRFSISGLALFAWMIFKGERGPNARQWLSATLLALLIFVVDYGLLFWAEQGLAAVMMATIPTFMAISEIVLLRTQKLTLGLALALLLGLCGVAVLVSRSLNLGGAPIDRAAAVALIVASVSWSVASSLTRILPLPSSKLVSSGSQMLAGGILLAFASTLRGEFHGFHPGVVSIAAWLALLYLIVFGSIIGFTAYLWLIHHQSPFKVGTYAYVNPLVAVLLGYFAGGEALGLRTIAGSLCVLSSVVMVTATRGKEPQTSVAEEAGQRE